jgi:hypothetical protein
VRVQRSVQTANGNRQCAGRPPESDSCRLLGHAPHGTPREVCFTRDMAWRTLFPPVAPLDTGYPSALEKRARRKHGAAFGDRREEMTSKTEARRGCGRWWELVTASVMALHSHDESVVKRYISRYAWQHIRILCELLVFETGLRVLFVTPSQRAAWL